MLAIGLMSGTSMDGIDAALIDTDGEGANVRIGFHFTPYDEAMRARLRAACTLALGVERPGPDMVIDPIARDLTLAHAEAVAALLAATGTAPDEVGVIGFHGQTVAHRPERGWTWQIGDGALLAQVTGIRVVHDFRWADVAAGGQGAPLAPGYHRALAGGLERPLGVLNLGGVGNLTWFGEDAWLSFDTGPANAPIDDWVREQTGATRDEGGALAAAGAVHDSVLDSMLDTPWFDLAPPKSLDRDAWNVQAVRGLSAADGAATLTAFSAATVALALNHVPAPPRRLLVTGGGRHNPTLMAMLERRTGIPCEPVEAVGWQGDELEAQAFAWMAVRVLDGKPTSWPETTGVPQPTSGGIVSEG
ncbi:anhydro-N-acetylmuramic acid kinase [Glacieibacterium frigidum]|uniref:Anhydro-N-acetylmuramic acid kinase n=1 Tax=Glacieibacterium frigidum TaxID=2593303 RepID=A0A552U9P2_9SPHN|nr:anhydro-N-acetylmuramic acid kinase [Glacieibacterium frigidum]TRW14909.1 anhydro-N-acetylmuramic acid kinase [Glacieibacterium frigidum]